MRNTIFLGMMLGSAMAIGACKKDADRPHSQPSASTQTPAPTPKSTLPTQPAPSAAKVEVDDVELGSAIGSDKKVVDSKDSFKPNETIYVSVETKGAAPDSTLTARWTYGDGQVVEESSQKIVSASADSEVATEFHVQKPDGFPAGQYKVQILLNGAPVASKDFKVDAG